MNLLELGLLHKTDKATYHQFCEFYQENLPKNPKRLLEIGVMDGASLRMWHDYYPDTEIIGLDIKEPLEIDGVTCIKMDATDPEHLKTLGMFDVIIDDGSHMTADQQKSFAYLYEHALQPGGYYVMEDIHTSFMPNYINTPETTYEYLQWFGDNVTFFAGPKGEKESFTAIVKKPLA